MKLYFHGSLRTTRESCFRKQKYVSGSLDFNTIASRGINGVGPLRDESVLSEQYFSIKINMMHHNASSLPETILICHVMKDHFIFILLLIQEAEINNINDVRRKPFQSSTCIGYDSMKLVGQFSYQQN